MNDIPEYQGFKCVYQFNQETHLYNSHVTGKDFDLELIAKDFLT